MQGPPLEEEKDGGRRCVPEWKNNGCYSLDIAGKRQLPVRYFHNSKNEDDDGCTRSSLYKAELLKARGLTSRLKRPERRGIAACRSTGGSPASRNGRERFPALLLCDSSNGGGMNAGEEQRDSP